MIPSVLIGDSKIALCRLGFGCAQLYGGRELSTSAKLIDAALGAGIRHFDTAPSYTYGTSEEALGELLAGVPSVTVATKCGIPHPPVPRIQPTQIYYRNQVRNLFSRFPIVKRQIQQARKLFKSLPQFQPHQYDRRHLSREEILRSLDESRKNLRGRSIDLLLIHDADQFYLDETLQETLQSFVKDGSIGSFGLTYGRSIVDPPLFGQIIQSKYANDAIKKKGCIAHQQYYGVLRTDGTTSHPKSIQQIRSQLQEVLAGQVNSSVIFTASTRLHISEIANYVNEFMKITPGSNLAKENNRYT